MWQAAPDCSTRIQTASWSQSVRSSTTRWVWPEVSPLRHSALRERLKYQASPRGDGLAQRLFIHVRDHQHVAGRGIGRDAGDEARRIEFGLKLQPFFALVRFCR